MKTIGIVGSRRRDSQEDFAKVFAAFENVRRPPDGIRIVSGGCPKGADRFAEIIARDYAIPIVIHKPKFLESKPGSHVTVLNLPRRYEFAKEAYARNTLIAKDADILIACVAPDRKGGTEDTIKKFERFHPGEKAILV